MGARLGFHQVLVQATGEVLTPSAFETHLTGRYLSR
jgi:Zn-dependent M32 family carboxypeptidase